MSQLNQIEELNERAGLILALRPENAARAIDVSLPYLLKAIQRGDLKAVKKRQPGTARGLTLITVDELRRFISTDSGSTGD